MKRLSIVLGMFVCLAFAFNLIIPGHASHAFKPGEVVIGACWDLTGPFAPSGTPIAAGERDCVRYVNEKLGGINGHKVKLIGIDTSYNMDREIAAYKKFRDEEKCPFYDQCVIRRCHGHRENADAIRKRPPSRTRR